MPINIGKLKLILLISFCLSVSIFSALFLFLQHPSVFAQIASGDINILDISIDKGGGKIQSGDLTIANSSIGNSTSGYFVTSGDTTVCAGHACKTDYDYDPGKQPTLQQLIINASQDAVAAGRYGTSGLRADDEGGNYYNALSIQPQFSGVKDDIELAGAAFVENINATDILGSTAFQFLLSSTNKSKGFVVIYANKNKNLSDGPRTGRCGFNFCSGFYYVYLDGRWDGPLPARDGWSTRGKPGFPQDRIVTAADQDLRVSETNHAPPTKLAFKAYFDKSLGSNTWGTYGFAITSTPLAGSFTNATPVPSATSLSPDQTNAQSISPGSEFYLFNLF